jgi:lipoprotein-anchoring transpeptidase ErfK/SrfK
MTAAFAVLIAAGVGGLLIYDATRADRVAHGVRAGGLDLGGMTRDAARRAVQARYGRAAAAPVVVTWQGRRFTLSPGASGAHVDAAVTAQRAVERSRGGNPLGRAVRELTGGEVHADVGLAIRWSPAAVARFVRGIARRVDRRPRDADIDFHGARLVRQHARNGLGLRRARLRAAIEERLRSPARNTPIAAPVVVTRRPDRTLAALAHKYPRVITINRAKKVLRFYRKLKLTQRYAIAVGQIGHKTPAGRYAIQSMQKNPAWHVPDEAWAGSLAGRVIPPGDPQNPLKARWMGFHDGAGIHGTAEINSLGAAASHGCIRMRPRDVIRLYRVVRVGTPVFIV